MAIFYVDTGSATAKDEFDYGTSWDTPFKNLAYAAAHATNSAGQGEPIIVSASQTYYPTSLSVRENGQIIAKYDERPIFDGTIDASNQQAYCFRTAYSGTYYENLEIKNFESAVWHYTNVAGYKLSISGCYVHDNKGNIVSRISGDENTGNIGVDSQADHSGFQATNYALVNECEFIRNSAFGGGGGQILATSGNVKIINCIFSCGTPALDRHLFGGQYYHHCTASFCTFHTTSSTGAGSPSSHGALEWGQVDNCIVSCSQPDQYIFNTLNPVANCIVSCPKSSQVIQKIDGSSGSFDTATNTGYIGWLSNAISFSAPSNMDYTLSSTSPAISGGCISDCTFETSNTSVDISGNTRGAVTWIEYETTPTPRVAENFTINAFEIAYKQHKRSPDPTNFIVSVGAHEYVDPNKVIYTHTRDTKPSAIPFSLTTRGIIFRDRKKPYLTSRSTNPEDLLSDGGHE